MSDQFIKEQRRDLMQLNSLLSLASQGRAADFEGFESHITDKILKDKVSHLKNSAKEWYIKDLEVSAFREEFQERKGVQHEPRWNLSGDGKIAPWIISHKWNDETFYKDYVSKFLIREVEQRERNILGVQREVVAIGR